MRPIEPNRLAPFALALVAALAFGCAEEPAPAVEEGAPTAAQDREIPGTHSPNDLDPITAQRFVDRVRIGRDLDADGQVPTEAEGEEFDAASTVHVSLEATDAPAGSVIRLNVLEDGTERPVWTEELEVPAGRSFVNFTIDGGELASGAYRAEIVIGDETVANRDFRIRA